MSMSSEGAAPDPEDTLVQYIVVRSDLGKDKGWPLGSVIAQGAHAATKTLWELRESENVKEYCGNVDSMHKVVLGAKSEKQLSNSAEKLDEAGERRRSYPRTARGMNTKNRSRARAARSCCHLLSMEHQEGAQWVCPKRRQQHSSFLILRCKPADQLSTIGILDQCLANRLDRNLFGSQISPIIAQITSLDSPNFFPGLEYRLWIEQPEGIPTALATMPYPRSIIKPVLKKLPLMK